MRRLLYIFLISGSAGLLQACHNSAQGNQNTDKPVPSQARETTSVWRDTNAVGTRTDR